MRFTNKDKKWIIAFSIMGITGFMLYVIMNIFSEFFSVDFPRLYTYTPGRHYIYMIWFIICWLGVLGILYYSLKGAVHNYKKKLKNKFFVFSSLIAICYAVLYFPPYCFPFSIIAWIMLGFLAVILICVYLMHTMGEDEI